ncbi:S49 family peptidase [Aureimonas fodinaquatilis]|uniref:S49 family peptidase n=2 Tax=Aureimonas fodinaquatilis TaxID=2565783 RepID=A0A5B0E315_9HYPH|nr:S49 family peptidase [Aureimonas fodinaquatilis]
MAGSAGMGRQSVSMAAVAPLLKKAFERSKAPVVAIEVNSPGGSPVQSRLIYRRIRELAAKHDKKVLVFCEDVAASGGYMIACAGDEIIADPSSIVGSIGVVSGGFGFVDLIRRIGVERRVYTAGQNKATLDPFQPEKPEDVAHLKSLQLDIHAIFIDLVRKSRGDKLANDPELFSGLFWSGGKGLELGLVDRLGDLHGVLTERFGEDVELEVIQAKKGFFSGLVGFGAEARSAALVRNLADVAEEKSLWGRYGL